MFFKEYLSFQSRTKSLSLESCHSGFLTTHEIGYSGKITGRRISQWRWGAEIEEEDEDRNIHWHAVYPGFPIFHHSIILL